VLPDGIFSNKKSQFGDILEGLAMEDVGILWSISWPNGISYGHLVHFVVIWYIFPVLVCCTEINLATLSHTNLWPLILEAFPATSFPLLNVPTMTVDMSE
jgi:hypothetical protein